MAANLELRIALGAGERELAGHRFVPLHADDGAARRAGEEIAGNHRDAGAGNHRHGDAEARLAHHIAGDRDVAQVWAPADADAGARRALDHVAADHGVGFHPDTNAGFFRRPVRTPRPQIAHDVAVHRGKPAAFVEIGDGNSGLGAVDHVVGDYRALEAELGIDRHLVERGTVVADDLDVGRGVAADRGKGGVADVVAAHDHVGGAKDVDRVAVLAGAAAARAGVLDPVVGDRAAIRTLVALPKPDAAIAGLGDGVGGDQQAATVVAEQRIVRRAGNGRVRDFAVAALKRDAVAAGAGDLAFGDADGFHVIEVHQRAALRQRPAAAVEHEAAERHAV